MSLNPELQLGSDHDRLGSRLRRAREDRGATLAMAAAALRLPQALVEAMEAEQFDRLGASIYVSGHVRSYLRWLGLPEALAARATAALPVEPPALQSTAHVSHLRFLADRYAVRAVYVVLTLSIILPGLWVATQRPVEQPVQASRPLDQVAPLPAAALGNPTEPGLPQPSAPSSSAPAIPEPIPPALGGEAQTVVASMAPFYPAEPASPQEAATEVAVDPASGPGWEFRFADDSWVEILDSEGKRLEYGLLRSGESRRFAPGQVARVALGNAGAVQILRDGEALSISEFQRANVARFAVSSDGSLSAVAP